MVDAWEVEQRQYMRTLYVLQHVEAELAKLFQGGQGPTSAEVRCSAVLHSLRLRPLWTACRWMLDRLASGGRVLASHMLWPGNGTQAQPTPRWRRHPCCYCMHPSPLTSDRSHPTPSPHAFRLSQPPPHPPASNLQAPGTPCPTPTPRVMLVCGADVLHSMADPAMWRQVSCVCPPPTAA